MAEAQKQNEEDVARVDFEFRRELARKIEGHLASFCYQCGACVGDCPATTYSEEFNPREIMLKVLYGLGDELVGEDSLLWQCTNCYNCHERCPQEVKPVEVIISLKNMLADQGIYPRPVEKVIETFEEKLRPGGYLLLGHSESLINLSSAFELRHLRNDLVYRRPDERDEPSDRWQRKSLAALEAESSEKPE